MTTVHTSSIQSLPLLARGKVRDNYAVGNDRILMVASDRLSRLRRDHGRADSRQGRDPDADGAVVVRPARPPVPQPPDRRCARKRGHARRSAAGRGPLDAGQAPEADPGRGGGARLPGRQRLEGIPGEPRRLRRAAARGPDQRQQAAAPDLHARRQGRGRRARREHQLRPRGRDRRPDAGAADPRDQHRASTRPRPRSR